MGNIDALRDWGHAKDYVYMQWLMLQQAKPEDYVIATGQQYAVRDFITWSAAELGITLEFRGNELEEVAVVTAVTGSDAPAVQIGDIVMRIDPKYFRPAEVETLLGDASKARQQLGWQPQTDARALCREMTQYDLAEAKRQAFLKRHGYHYDASKEG